MRSPAGCRRRVVLADAALLSVAVIWGFNFTVTKDAINDVPPLTFLLLQHLVATTLLVVVAPQNLTRARRRDWLCGAVLGALLFIVLVAQTVGLQYTTPAKAGFITGLNVAIVPFLVWVFARRAPGAWQLAGAGLAAVGLAVLCLNGDLTLAYGDALMLVAAVALAGELTALGFFAPRASPGTLAVVEIATATVLLLVVTPFVDEISLALPWQVWTAVVWTAAMGTAYAFFARSSALRYASSSHAAVILCLESAFAALFGILAGMDSLSLRLFAGAGLIFVGVLIVELRPGRAEPQAPPALLPEPE